MRPFLTHWLLLPSSLLIAHCSSTPSTSSGGGGTRQDGSALPNEGGAPPSDAATDSVAPDDAVAPPAGGTISGSADGTPFSTVGSSYLAGAPDDPSTTVVYVFSKPVNCSDLGTPGWDTRITNGTQFLEMKMFGQSPGSFTAVTTVTPAPGEASVNYTLSSTTGTPKESSSSGGTVTLASLVAGAYATGAFALKFGSNDLSGTFSALFCPGGREP